MIGEIIISIIVVCSGISAAVETLLFGIELMKSQEKLSAVCMITLAVLALTLALGILIIWIEKGL